MCRFTHSCLREGQKSTTNIFLFTLHLMFCESASHRTWNLPFYWPMRPQDLLVSQTLVLELNSYVMPSLYLRAGDPNSGPRVCNVQVLYTLIRFPSFANEELV